MKLSKWAIQQGIHYQTAWQWFHAGQIPGAYQTDTGSIFVPDPEERTPTRVVVYARVSNRERKESLKQQADRCLAFANGRGLSVDHVYSEVASGMNDSRRELWRMLDSNPTTVIVENKDRLTRFGFTYLDRLLQARGCEVLVLHPGTTDTEDLLKDLTSVIYSFCARLYGRRRAKNKVDDIKRCL
jgi:putative resolvase